MNEQALVSVIIPVFNAEKYVEQCINSILTQTWQNIEIIIVDDGSTDNSFQTAKKFEREKVKLVQKTNEGAGIARNRGLNMAQGKYIQFMDADDLLSENKIEEQVNLLESNPGYVAVCTTVYFDDGTNPYAINPEHDWYSLTFNDPVDFLIKLYGGGLIGPGYGGMIQPNAWLTPREIIKKAGDWNPMRNPDDDGEFFCRVLLEGRGIVYAGNAVNYYRKFKTNKSLSAQKNYQDYKNILTSIFLKKEHLLAKTNLPAAKLALSRLFCEHSIRCYPEFKDLAKRAESAARELAPDYQFTPYSSGIKSVISKLFGWKAVKWIQNIKWRSFRNNS